jgi:hypothetical protein
MRRYMKLVPLAAVLAVAGPVWGSTIPNPPYEEKVAKSDVVVVGRVEALGVHRWNIEAARVRNRLRDRPPGLNTIVLEDEAPGLDEMARVKVLHVLKGRPIRRLRVLASNSIAELDPDCCDVGRTYVFFLRLQAADVYAPVIGAAGVVPLTLDEP